MSEDSVYQACATFAMELANQGVAHAVISPGSRSTPLTLTFAQTPGITTWTRLDERSAAFFALGIAKTSGVPVVLVCTSGTAASNYLPAITEANLSDIPLIVLTANRPPELRDWGAAQTITQTNIYGDNVRWFEELPIFDKSNASWFQRVAARAYQTSIGSRPGPVHLDWPFREPLEPVSNFSLPENSPKIRATNPTQRLAPEVNNEIAAVIENASQGLVIAGPMNQGSQWHDAVALLCKRTGFPLLADPLSQLRFAQEDVEVITHHDHLLRTSWADRAVPEVVIRVGGPPTCKPLRLWLERHQPRMIMFDPANTWADPSFTVTDLVPVGHEGLGEIALIVQDRVSDKSWGPRWVNADTLAGETINEILDSERLSQPAIAREIGRQLSAADALYVSNSMPVRDIDSFLEADTSLYRIFGNRGASGIDGVISSAAGAAVQGKATTLLIGDLAFQHDIGGLIATKNDGSDLTILLLDDNGGGIFNYLPIAQVTESQLFSEFFTTPQGLNFSELVKSLGIAYHEAPDLNSLKDLLKTRNGLRVIRVPIDSSFDIDQHRRLAAAVEEATAGL